MNIKKEIHKFVLPLIAMNLLQMIIGQIALINASRDSIQYLSSINTIQTLFFALGGILGAFNYAFNIKGAKLIGAKEEKHYRKFLVSSLKLDLIIGFIFCGLTIIGGRVFLSTVYGFDGEMLDIAFIYLVTTSPYILLTLLMFTLTSVIKIEKKTTWILKVSVLTSVLHILLNILFVRFFHLGIIGAGIALIISLFSTVLIYVFLVKGTLKKLKWKDAVYILELITTGLPLMGQEIFEGVLFIIIFEALIARIGIQTLAIYAIIIQVFSIVKMPTFMYGQAITIFLSEALGKKDMEKAKEVFHFSIKGALFSYIFLSFLSLIAARLISNLFTTDAFVVSQTPAYMLIVLSAMVFTAIYETSKNALQASNEEKYVLKATSIVNICILFAMIYLRYQSSISFVGLYLLNGLNILILSIIFLYRCKKKLKLL